MKSILWASAMAMALGCGPMDEQEPSAMMDQDLRAEEPCAVALRWRDEHASAPTSLGYDELLAYPQGCRKLVYGALAKPAQRAIWIAQIDRYRARHPALSEEQHAALDRALAFIAKAFSGDDDGHATAPIEGEERVRSEMIRLFGPDARMIAEFGQPDADVPMACDCNLSSDWCGPLYGQACRAVPCSTRPLCGTLGGYPCNGRCGAGN